MEWAGRVAAIAGNRESGASALAAEAVALLREAVATATPLDPLARALVLAQPSMAPVWNAVRAALTAVERSSLERYAQQMARANRALMRYGGALLAPDTPLKRLELVTLSFSGTVAALLEDLGARQPITVSCADGLPALEGRRLALRLSAAGLPVTFYSDAALAQALEGADAVLVGADAVTPDWFLNKSGTRMLAAAAAQYGVPVYVCATRDKFLSTAVGARLTVRDESPDEIWPSPPPLVTVRNRYFERTPLDLVSAVISDSGVLGAALMADACPTQGDEALLRL